MPKPIAIKKPVLPAPNRIDTTDCRLHPALAYLVESDHRVRMAELVCHLARISGESRPACRRQVRRLVRSGELAYTYEFGSSYLEPSFYRPVRISRRLIRIPADSDFIAPAGTLPVRLAAGSAFGCGRHPTTRLALQAVEAVFDRGDSIDAVLDVGTGSGILVIAAVLLGAGRGRGIDIDSCARVEAAENVHINQMSARIRIGDEAVETLAQRGDRYAMVIANLRTPSLSSLRTALTRLVRTGGSLVVSGIREEEARGAIREYGAAGWRPVWEANEKGWRALVMTQREE